MRVIAMLSTVGMLLLSVAMAGTHSGPDARTMVTHVIDARRQRAPVYGLDDGEFLVDTSREFVPVRASAPAIAYDGVNTLVVWEDYRKGYDHDVFGARLTPDGTVLDPAGIPITTTREDDIDLSVAFNGSCFLVVWSGDSIGYPKIHGARVGRDGSVLDPQGITIASGTDPRLHPAVASDGHNFLVVWTFGGTRLDVYGTRVDSTGRVLDPIGFRIARSTYPEVKPAAAFDGTNYLVVWNDERNGRDDIYGARVHPDGTVLDTSGIAIVTDSAAQYFPQLAFDGSNYLVVWEDWRDTLPDIYGARVTPEGTVLDSPAIAVCNAPSYQEYPRVAFENGCYLVGWQDSRNDTFHIYGARVNPAGQVLDPNGIAIESAGTFQGAPALAGNGADFRVVWNGDRPTGVSAFTRRVSSDGIVLDSATPISLGVNAERTPAVAQINGTFLVAWQDYGPDSNCEIRASRVTASGSVLDPAGILVSGTASDKGRPTVAGDGTNFLIAWADGRMGSHHIFGARVSPAGTVLDPEGIALWANADSQIRPSVAFDGVNYLVVWADLHEAEVTQILGTRVSQNGSPLDPGGIPVSSAGLWRNDPVLAFDGTNYLAAWTEAGSPSGIFAARVTPGAQVLDTGIPVQQTGSPSHPAVGCDGGNFLIVWDNRLSDTLTKVYGARVSSAGEVLDTGGLAITPGVGVPSCPAVAYDGADWLVTCTDRGSSVYGKLLGARMTRDGLVLETFPITEPAGPVFRSALAREPGGPMLLVYDAWADRVEGKPYYNIRVWGKLGPFGGIEEKPLAEIHRAEARPTIIRGVLGIGPQLTANSLRPGIGLFDANGRRVAKLHAGANDVSRLAPGVYFVRNAADGRAQKVVIER